MMEKESFILHNCFYDSIKTLKNEQLGKLLRAIFNYTINGEITQDEEILIAFMFIKNQIDIDSKKWENIKQKRSEAGKNHTGNQYTRKKEEMEQNGTKWNKMEQNGTNGTVNVNDNVNVNVNVNDIINIKDNINNIYTFIEENFGRSLSPIEYEQVSLWEDSELTRYAIKQAVLNGKYNLKYINAILNNWKKNKITTVQQAQQESNNFKQVKVPTWLDEKIGQNLVNQEEEQEFLEKLKRARNE